MIKCPFCKSKLSNQNNHDGTHQIVCPSCGFSTPKRGEFLECLDDEQLVKFGVTVYYWLLRGYSAHMGHPQVVFKRPDMPDMRLSDAIKQMEMQGKEVPF